MNRKIHRMRAVGLAILAICGLTAFMAASAQANWLEEGKEIEVNLPVLVKAHSPEIEMKVASLNIEFRCKTVAANGLKLLALSEKAEGKVNFSNCEAYSPITTNLTGTLQKNCTPENQPIEAGGTALIILHNSKNYVLLAGTPFTTIKLGALCALAETSEVKGSLVVECGQLVSEKFAGEDCKNPAVTHLIQPAPAELFPTDNLKFGENGATLNGIAAISLVSEKEWAGHV